MITEKKEEKWSTFILQMEADINEDKIELKFKSSTIIRFEKVSSSPVICKLSVETDVGKTLNIPINNKGLIDKLKNCLSQKDLQTCVEVLKEQKTRIFRKIREEIEGEIDLQKYEQEGFLEGNKQ